MRTLLCPLHAVWLDKQNWAPGPALHVTLALPASQRQYGVKVTQAQVVKSLSKPPLSAHQAPSTDADAGEKEGEGVGNVPLPSRHLQSRRGKWPI